MEEMVQFRSPVRKPQSGEKKNRKVLSSDSENESTASNHGTIAKWCVFNAYLSCDSLCMVLSSNGGVGVCELAHFFFFLFFCGIMLMYILFFTGCDEWVEVFIEAEKSWICKYMFMHIYFMFLYYYYYLPILSPCF